MAEQEAPRRELQELMEKYDTALLTTTGRDGHLHTRPMALQHRSTEEGIWFATSEDSAKVDDLATHEQCCVTMHGGQRDSTYVSISGRGTVVRNREIIHRLWDVSWKPWFPEGPDQKDLVLIRVEPEHAEYVHPHGGKLRVLFTMAKRLVTHSREEPAPKQEVELTH